jgi:hypothetical protein
MVSSGEWRKTCGKLLDGDEVQIPRVSRFTTRDCDISYTDRRLDGFQRHVPVENQNQADEIDCSQHRSLIYGDTAFESMRIKTNNEK